MSDATTALEEKWAQEEASKAPLEKAYEKIGQKKTDEEKLNPEKLEQKAAFISQNKQWNDNNCPRSSVMY